MELFVMKNQDIFGARSDQGFTSSIGANTVDGSEIQGSPVEVGSFTLLFPLLREF